MTFVNGETVYWDDDGDKLERQGTVSDALKYQPDIAVHVPKEGMTVIFGSDKLRKTSKLIDGIRKITKTSNTIYLSPDSIRNLLIQAGYSVPPAASVSILRPSGNLNIMDLSERIKIEWES